MEIVQIATILSPIVAVLLAFWTSRSASRDISKMVKCLKKLAQIQIRKEMLYLKKEADEEHAISKILLERSRKLSEDNLFNDENWSKEMTKFHREKESDIEDRKDFSFDKRMVIVDKMNELIKLSKEIDKI